MRYLKLIQAVLSASLFIFLSTSTQAATNPEEFVSNLTAPETGYTYIDGKSVTYKNIDGWAVVEGDIVLGRVEDIELHNAGARVQSIVMDSSNNRWPNGIVPYEYEPGLSPVVINNFRLAAEHWEQKTDIRFVQRTSANASRYPVYVEIQQSSTGCSALLGYNGYRGYIFLAPACIPGIVIHEIGHVLGFRHEHNRDDRDAYVSINWENIEAGNEGSFEQYSSGAVDLFNYDYGSIMHYGRNAFSNGNGPTIEPINPPSAVIGQRTALSPTDIASAVSLYHPLSCTSAGQNSTRCSYQGLYVSGMQFTWTITGYQTYIVYPHQYPSMPYTSPGSMIVFTHPSGTCAPGTIINMEVSHPQITGGSFTCGEEQNLALFAKASASSTFSGYSPNRINDGSTITTVGSSYSWANNAGQSGPHWVELDFDFKRTFSKVVLYTSAGYPLRDYDVQYWNGSAWATLTAIRGNTALSRTHTFSAVTSSKLRILGISGPNNQPYYRRVNELQVYE